ncbi:MAG: UDP-N-acetylmuramate dehydrogenase [Candidatus Gracilibacteria bacterium]
MALKDFPGVKQQIPLKLYSTFRVGGPADYFYSARDVESFLKISSEAKSENCRIFVLGNGSNVLFLDEGFRGLVIKMEMTGLEIKEDRLIAEAGATWPSILKVAEKAGLSGLEEMSGLPGTLGGAVCGNAGCFGKEMAQLVESALLYDPLSGKTKEVDQNYFNFRYRWSRLKETHEIVLRVTLKLKNRSHEGKKSDISLDNAGKQTLTSFASERAKKQPPGFSSGSFFKNPSPEKPAGLLIDQCGLKGFRVGGAQISPKHANFFINTGMASAQDLLSLRDQVKKSVFDRFQIALEEEVIIVKNNP